VSVTINVNNLSLCHKGSNGISTATVPDVCKTPTPGGPAPIPYPNISMSSDLENGTTTVEADGGNMIAIKGSDFSRSTGDEPGTIGGVKSNVNMKESKWILYSFDVMLEGANACRLTDKKTQNHENTVDAMGLVQTPLVVTPPTANYTRKRANLTDNVMKKDKRSASKVGDGTTAAAVYEEIKTLKQVGGKWHYKKAKELANAYKKRDDDATKEEQRGDITKSEADDLRNDTTEGYVRNVDAVQAADQVPSPPWPT